MCLCVCVHVVCAFVCACACVCNVLVCMCVYMCACACVCMCVCMCVYACVYACAHVCVHVRVCEHKFYIYRCIVIHMCRRNHTGDKEEQLKQQENQVPDFLCLCGQIFKDKFVESNYSDNESRVKTIHW